MVDMVRFPQAIYLAARVNFLYLRVCSLWVQSWKIMGQRFFYNLDRIGTLIASAGLAMLSYDLARAHLTSLQCVHV